jgi:hypothetical protein
MKFIEESISSITFKQIREQKALSWKLLKKTIESSQVHEQKCFKESSSNEVEDMGFAEFPISDVGNDYGMIPTNTIVEDVCEKENKSPEPCNLESGSKASEMLKYIRIEFAKNILYRIPESVEGHYRTFDESSIVSYFRDKPELMKICLASFSKDPFIDPELNLSPERQLDNCLDEMKSHRTFHGSTKMTNTEIEEAFFSAFSCHHFVLGRTELELYPVGLYTLNERFEKDWKNEMTTMKDKTISHLSNRFRSERFYGYIKKIKESHEPRERSLERRQRQLEISVATTLVQMHDMKPSVRKDGTTERKQES